MVITGLNDIDLHKHQTIVMEKQSYWCSSRNGSKKEWDDEQGAKETNLG
jgi:hypothetical protein